MKANVVEPATPPLTDPTAWPLLLGLGCLRGLSAMPESLWPTLSRVLGSALWHLVPKRRAIVRANLKIAFPDIASSERETLAKTCFRKLSLSLIETGKLWFGPSDFAARRVRIEGIDRLREVNRERPVLLATPHFHAIELVGLALSQQVPLSAFYARAKNPHFERFEVAKRLRFAASVIERHQTHKLVRTLKAGGMVWWVPDQAVAASNAAVESRFFGQRVLSSRATAWLLEKTSVCVMPVAISRDSTGTLVARIEPPLDWASSDINATTALDALFESLIRQQPDEYFWMHRRFKPARPGDIDPYREQ